MAYSTSLPPVRQSIGPLTGGPALWSYTSADAVATVRAANYFSNAVDLGMKLGDFVLSYNTAGVLGSISVISAVASTGTTMIALT